jgi:DNA-directed RNA polymerase alpha subunit
MTQLKLEIDGLTGPQLTRIRHAVFKTPSVSFVDCTIFANDTGIADEVMSHHLTMVPVYLDPDFALVMHDPNRTIPETEHNTLVFTVTIDCPPPTVTGEAATQEIDYEVHVFARDLRFNPVGKQADQWLSHPSYSPSIAPVMVLHPDMHLMTLRSRGRRSFQAELKASLGTVDENTRFTSVLNCYFKPRPIITLHKKIMGNAARTLVHLCKQAVFGWDDPDANDTDSDSEDEDGPHAATVTQARAERRRLEREARNESRVYFDAYQNETSYSLMNTLVPTLRDGLDATNGTQTTDTDLARGPLRVLKPNDCNQCMACQNSNLRDIEDLTRPSLADAVSIALPATRVLFILRCNDKQPAMDLLKSALTDLIDHDANPVYAQLLAAL